MSNHKRTIFSVVVAILSVLLIELVSSIFVQYNTLLRIVTVVLYFIGFLWFYIDIYNVKYRLYVRYSICSVIYAAAGIGCVLSFTMMIKPVNEIIFAFGAVCLAACITIFITFVKMALHYTSEIQE